MDKKILIEKLKKLEQTNIPFALYLFREHDSLKQRVLLLEKIQKQIYIKSLRQLNTVLNKINHYQKNNYYISCALNYETGYGFEKKLNSFLPRDNIIGWVGFFRQATVFPIEHFNYALKQTRRFAGQWPDYLLSSLAPTIDYKNYEKNIIKIKDYIAQGDTYQVNYTFALKGHCFGNQLSVFYDLYNNQPVGYAALIKNSKQSILSLSPELFFSKKGIQIITKPMKGTAPRSVNKEQDRKIRWTLSRSQKNKAENLMIVDLLRNDLGRLCEVGTIAANKIFEIESYKTVYQMTTTVIGKLKKSINWNKLFTALFPCGSVTGAPKVRTMEIINELEAEQRGIYTGALGYIKPNGDCQFNVPIRTLEIMDNNQCKCGIGSGVVIDSKPKAEWKESHDKSKFLIGLTNDYQLIETMSYAPLSGIEYLNKHLKRLEFSAGYFGYDYDERKLIDSINNCCKKIKGLQKHRLRLLLFKNGKITIENTVLVNNSLKAKGIIKLAEHVITSSNIFLYHKTTNRPLYNNYFKKAEQEKINDYIFRNEKGNITEGSISNIFIIKNNQWYTPPIKDGLLPGIMRDEILKKKKAIEKTLTVKSLEIADQIYITNSVRGIIPVQLK